MFASVISVIASYLIGSISFSILMARWLRKIDIRQHGSGNAGATNTLRVLGAGPAVAVLLLDAAKGIAAALIGFAAAGSGWVPVACSLAVIAGHNWPIFFGFKGGKGIATTAGVVAILAFWPSLLAGIVAIATIALTRYVSLGSIVFAVLLPVSSALFEQSVETIVGMTVIAVLGAARHHKNIIKLINGTENRLGRSKKGDQHGA